jgi:hypothetical protein
MESSLPKPNGSVAYERCIVQINTPSAMLVISLQKFEYLQGVNCVIYKQQEGRLFKRRKAHNNFLVCYSRNSKK